MRSCLLTRRTRSAGRAFIRDDPAAGNPDKVADRGRIPLYGAWSAVSGVEINNKAMCLTGTGVHRHCGGYRRQQHGQRTFPPPQVTVSAVAGLTDARSAGKHRSEDGPSLRRVTAANSLRCRITHAGIKR